MTNVIELPAPDAKAQELRRIVEDESLPEAVKTRARARLALHPAAPKPTDGETA